MINRIEIDGVDKTGKDLICAYIDRLSNRRYVVHSRGILSMITYNDVYERNYDYSQELANNKDTLVVHLEAYLDDLQIRHKINNEPKIDIEKDLEAFSEHVEILKQNGIKVLTFNTSITTPIIVAKTVIDYVERENKEWE